MTRPVIKIALVGAGGSGKTTIAARLVTGKFVDVLMTVGLNIETWSITNEDTGDLVRAAVFDLGGQPQFRFFQRTLLVGTEAVIIVIDVTRTLSVVEVDSWINMIQHIPRNRWVLVANKADEDWIIDMEEIRQKAIELNIPYFVVSAVTGQGFDELVKYLSNLMFDIAEIS